MLRKLITGISALMFAQTLLAQDLPRAIIHTSEGDITVELYADRSPVTVENFIGLSTGAKPWTHPTKGAQGAGTPLYNGTVFHRVVDGFMIQGGDPLGDGQGGPGYTFKNEDSDLSFDQPGRVAMANRGRDTNGSQFFITVAPVQRLDGDYTIFGQVVEGMDVVTKISKMPVRGDQAVNPAVIKSVEILKPGSKPSLNNKTSTATVESSSTSPQTQ